jgi:hypothetical protein
MFSGRFQGLAQLRDIKQNGKHTDENDMIIELAFVFAFALHFSHVLERVKHALDDAFVPSVHQAPNLKAPGPDELVLDAADV